MVLPLYLLYALQPSLAVKYALQSSLAWEAKCMAHPGRNLEADTARDVEGALAWCRRCGGIAHGPGPLIAPRKSPVLALLVALVLALILARAC